MAVPVTMHVACWKLDEHRVLVTALLCRDVLSGLFTALSTTCMVCSFVYCWTFPNRLQAFCHHSLLLAAGSQVSLMRPGK